MYQVAEILLDLKAVKVSINPPFTWTSGIKSPVYCDNRILISFPRERDVIIDALLTKMEDEGLMPDFVAGTATAGIPWAAFIADRLNIPMVFVRGKPKGHGTKKQIEGQMPAGSKVLVIEDLISTGKSSIVAADAILKEGQSEVMGVLALMTWEMPLADQNFTEHKIPLWTLTKFSELIPMASKKGYIGADDVSNILRFRENPAEWGKNL